MARLPYTLHLHGLTDVGRARSNNEDAFALVPPAGLAVLADGMGGYNAGEVASQMLTQFLRDELGRWLAEAEGAPPAAVKQAMAICVDNANRAVFESAQDNPRYAGMGTTLVMAVFRPEGVWLGHIGDSRAYRLRAGRFEQLTRDHSLLQEQLDAGLITPEQAQFALHKNLVTRAVGVEAQVELEAHLHLVQDDDLLLLCSDGLSDMLSDTELQSLCQAHAEKPQDLEPLSQALVSAANERGGRDNITAVLARVGGRGGAASSKPWWGLGRR
ncbi:MAG: Stp1/IreP family PP2C-type Ser/Thr phosphatase [Burkholderiales bacterium]|uniref:Stp1/IreP family PP2C-type Ser/Thr phosphatase n=1 Tax=Inhella sp. TaxID=1921806 RepID=UPI001AD3B2CE|nr:Stp1/IreP family PP2C-type Ser/Thr phosphatase [Burkholderiales bacterium]